MTRLHQLSPVDVRSKVARVEARVANRDRLKRIREALAKIQSEVEHALDEKRQSSASDRDYLEDQLVRQLKSVRADCAALEISNDRDRRNQHDRR